MQLSLGDFSISTTTHLNNGAILLVLCLQLTSNKHSSAVCFISIVMGHQGILAASRTGTPRRHLQASLEHAFTSKTKSNKLHPKRAVYTHARTHTDTACAVVAWFQIPDAVT